MGSFQEPFETHFRNEIEHIANLSTHPRAMVPGSADEAAAAAVFRSWGKATVTKAGIFDVVPFFLMNLDGSAGFEDGAWARWPPMPAPIRWGLANVVGAWHGGWWKFASCDGAGNRKQLYATVPVREEGVGHRGTEARK